MTAFCDLTTVSIEHMQNIAAWYRVQSRIHCVPGLYTKSIFCDNFGNIEQNLVKFQH